MEEEKKAENNVDGGAAAEQGMVSVEFQNDSDGSTARVRVPAGTKVTEAAVKAGVTIPTLCHHPRLTAVGKCGVCVCSVEHGPTPTQLACSTVCRQQDDGSPMRVHVGGPALNGLANAALRRNLNSSVVNQMQRYAANNDFAPGGMLEIEELGQLLRNGCVDTSSASIVYDPSLCIGCSRCVRACNDIQNIRVLEAPMPTSNQPTVGIASVPPCMTTRAGRPLKETDCISCGQCTIMCPTGAIREVDHTARVMRALADPGKVVVLQTAPSVRVTIAEMFGGCPGGCSEGRLVGSAKACGFRFVFDTNVAADLTIMEEANELLERINIAQNGTEEEQLTAPLPMFTSCCPGWINLVEQSYPELIPHLSSCRSPMSMLSSVIRHYWWPKQVNTLNQHGATTKKQKIVDNSEQDERMIDQSKLYVVAVMPCTAKKDEIARGQFTMANGQPETDAVLTVRELARLIELRGVAQRNNYDSFMRIPELVYDNPFGESTGAAVIFGVTGGVMEAALRTAADVLGGKSLENVKYESVRGLLGIKKSTIQLGPDDASIGLDVAVVHQMKNVREFLAQIEEDKASAPTMIEIMCCPGGCIGGGGLPQSRNPDILSLRTEAIYSMDERMVKRKSHDNEAVKGLYKDLLGKPLSHLSHELLHTHYFPRPRKPAVVLKASQSVAAMDLAPGDDSDNTIYVVFGTQSGTAAQAAKEVKLELQQFIGRSKKDEEAAPSVCLVAGNALSPDKLVERLAGSLAAIFVTCTFGEGEFPETMVNFWSYLEKGDADLFTHEGTAMLRYAVFGLGSSQYAVGDQFNRAARRLDQKLSELGGERIVDVGLGDDQSAELYHGEFDTWLENLLPKLVGKASGARLASMLDPPEPLFRVSLAAGGHTRFRPLPPNYHFLNLESSATMVSEGYDRPASLFTFETELDYEVGDHLAVLPRNPGAMVERIMALYFPAFGTNLLSVEAVDHLADSPFPATLSAKELLTQYLDLGSRPTRSFFKQLIVFATTSESRQRLRLLFEKDNQEEFEVYTETHTYADVLCEFAETALPPFEYLLSMIPVICPRLYSIASSPLHREKRIDLLIVENKWQDAAKRERLGLCTQFLVAARPGEKVAAQIRRGILQLPKTPTTPILMFGLGTGVAPFRGFLQHRHCLLNRGEKLGPATLYIGVRHKEKDYYLKEDYQTWIKEGVLSAVHPAFSHDNTEARGGKLYFLPDLISDEPTDMIKALQLQGEQAEPNKESDPVHVYYCGPAFGIPEKIQDAMESAICVDNSGHKKEDTSKNRARAFIDRLVRLEDRFHAECF